MRKTLAVQEWERYYWEEVRAGSVRDNGTDMKAFAVGWLASADYQAKLIDTLEKTKSNTSV